MAPGPGGYSSPANDTGPLALGQSFGTRYHIIRLLGVGGMGAVYQAWDAELGVAVALKVIRPSAIAGKHAAAEVERRFKRELLLARQVTHRSVVRIHDLGDIDGIKYITMSYVEGTDLASLLKREGKQSVPTVMRMARSVAAGLVAAHSSGVVHRDLKPANIMIGHDGEALIMDFGVALSTGEPTTPTADVSSLPAHLRRAAEDYAVTTAAAIVGTVEYMAPEQARGLPVDQRADVYAFGLILYDALLGRRRHEHAASALEELQRRLVQPLPPLDSIEPTIPAALAGVIARCLQPDPALRFQSSADMAAALDRLDDDGTPVPVARRLTGRMVAMAAALVIALLAGTFYITRQLLEPVQEHESVSVVIADLDNRTGDAAFDHAVEPMLRRALEGASFITAYDRSRLRPLFGVQPPERLDADVARQLAVREGLGVVLAGGITLQRGGYEISLQASEAVSGAVVASARGRAASREDVLETATKLITRIRNALGDETSESAQMFAMQSLSATSLDVARAFAAAVEAQADGKWEQAESHFLNAITLDPKFGNAYLGLAAVSRNLLKPDAAARYTDEALKHLEGMTEREQLSATALYFRGILNYEECVKRYGDLIARYAADVAARNQRALCLSKMRDLGAAVDEMQYVVKLLPRRPLFRANLAVYAAYGGDFQTAEREALAIEEPSDLGTLALALSQLGQGRPADAMATFHTLASVSARGASWSAAGLADIALYQGRFTDAIRILEAGATRDLAENAPGRAAKKLIAQAYAHLSSGAAGDARRTAQRALDHSASIDIQYLAARIFIETDALPAARDLADRLAAGAQAEPRAYARAIEGLVQLTAGEPQRAVELLTQANQQLDTWLGRFDLGRAYFELARAKGNDRGALLQANAEFETCLKRRGEALSLFVDEWPTYGYFPSVYYHQARVREALNTDGFRDTYRQYLAIRGDSSQDPLVRAITSSLQSTR